MFETSLIVESLTASRGGFALFENLSFELKAGAALRVTGPNGSGKTTLLRCLAGLVQPDAGRITIQSENTFQYLAHLNGMKPQLTVAENLNFWAKMQSSGNVTSAIETLNLTRLKDLPFSVLSSGQKRRVGIARLLLSPRAVWLLDEPTVGLDIVSISVFETVLENQLSEGGIVIAATHTPLGKANWQTLDLQPVTIS